MPTFQKVTIDTYELTHLSFASLEVQAKMGVGAIANRNASVISTYGSYGATPWYMEAMLSGVTAREDLQTIIGHLERKRPVRFKAEVYGGVGANIDVYGQVMSIRASIQGGFEDPVSSMWTYPVKIIFMAGPRTDQADRYIEWNAQDDNDTFSITSTRIVPMPVDGGGTYAIGETATFTRYVNNGAGGTYSIPCVASPVKSKRRIKFAVNAEGDMEKGNVTTTRDATHTNEYVMQNGHLKVQTCHDETNKGPVQLFYYNGAAWIDLALLKFYLSASGGAGLQEITGGDAPDVTAFTPENPYRQGLRLIYPATTTDADEGTVELELDYGRPILRANIINADATAKIACAYRMLMTPITFQYWTHSVTEEDANDAAHGTPDIVAGDTDAVNASWLHTTTGAAAAATILAGFARRKMADSDDVANDAGAYWDYLEQRFDNVSFGMGYPTEPNADWSVRIFAGRYDKIGSRTAAQLADEAICRLTQSNTVIRKV